MVAGCDAEILGRSFNEGELDITASRGFYGGQVVDEDGLIGLMADATSANLLGDRVVEAAVRRGLVDEGGVLRVCGLKHAQVYVI